MSFAVVHGALHVSNVCKNGAFCAVNCGFHCPTSTSWAAAYPHFHRCAPFSDCRAKTAFPLPASVCPNLFITGCKTTTVFGVSAFTCGPGAGTGAYSHCGTGTASVVGCATKPFMASLLAEARSKVTSFNSNTFVKLSVFQ